MNFSIKLNLCFVLQVIFALLKLFGVISWDWILVLIPMWIDLAIVVGRIIFAIVTGVCDKYIY